MTERDLLIGLLKSPHKAEQLRKIGIHIAEYEDDCIEAMVADFLLANGVIVPPCKIGTHLWRVTKPYRQDPKVTEFVVKNFRTTGKKHQLQIEVQAVNVPVTNWMRFKDLHTSKAEAERELAERKLKNGCEQ